MRNPFKKSFNRGDEEKLFNPPQMVMVGGCGESEQKKVAIREPSIEVLDEHIQLFIEGITGEEQEDSGWFAELRRDPTGFVSSIKPWKKGRLKPVVGSFSPLIAKLVGESREYVLKEMSLTQALLVILAYMRAVGMFRIQQLLMSALEEWSGPEGAETEGPIQPPHSPEEQSASVAN